MATDYLSFNIALSLQQKQQNKRKVGKYIPRKKLCQLYKIWNNDLKTHWSIANRDFSILQNGIDDAIVTQMKRTSHLEQVNDRPKAKLI